MMISAGWYDLFKAEAHAAQTSHGVTVQGLHQQSIETRRVVLRIPTKPAGDTDLKPAAVPT